MLPFLHQSAERVRRQIVAFRGINYSDTAQDGDLRDGLNLSARRFPYLTTRRARRRLPEYSGITALTARGGLVAVRGTDLLFDGLVVGQVAAGEKQFAVVNTKLVIWPDKLYLDLNTRTMGALEATLTGTGAEFGADGTLKVTGWDSLTRFFRVGDGVTISGCEQEFNNKTVIIERLTPTELGVGTDVFRAATETGPITIQRRVPDLDFICESENRLWGCSSQAQTIYASALGDPTNFDQFNGRSTDSYAAPVGSAGPFTGCCKYASSVLCWKETKLHKVLGSFPAEYSVYSYDLEGLQAGCGKSLQMINQVLYYKGLRGVYAYAGGTPTLVSTCFGERIFSAAVGGSDGETYYLSLEDGEGSHLFTYGTQTGLWMREDDTRAVDFARVGRDLYFLDQQGDIWLADAGTEDGELPWMAQFAPFHETLQGRKLYSKLLLRLELPPRSWVLVETRCDGGRWLECGKLLGRDGNAVSLRVPLNRCDSFEVRLSGRGPCALRGMQLEYLVGSDV